MINLRSLTFTLLSFGLLAATDARAIDACSLLTKDEIREVQGEDFTDAKSSSRPGGEIVSWQCFYVLPTFSNSVSLEVVEDGSDAKEPHTVRKLWNVRMNGRQVERDQEEESEREGRKGTQDSRVPVRRVGEQALWVRGGPSGALYALIGDRWLRLSLGGNLPEAQKIARARQLVRMAIKQMNRQDRAAAVASHK